MNPYRDWMMDFYRNRLMNDKSGPMVLLARRKLVVALEQGGKQSRNERRLALALQQGGTGHAFFPTHTRTPR
jgi:hypothetical protein